MAKAPDTMAHAAMKVQGLLMEAAVRANPSIEHRKMLTTMLDREVVRTAQIIAPPLVLELGAHQAWFSRTAKATLPDARVLAFEANPEVHAKHIEKAEAAGIEYVNRAVSDTAGTVTLSVPIKRGTQAIKTMGSLLHHQDAIAEQSIAVEAVRLDDYLGDDANLRNVMWIDVEGAMAMVLRGAERTLSHCEMVYAEIEPSELWPGQMIDSQVFDHLRSFGLIPVLRDVQRKKRGYNVLFLRPERIDDPAIQKMIGRFGTAIMSAASGTAAAPNPDRSAVRERRKARRAAADAAAVKT